MEILTTILCVAAISVAVVYVGERIIARAVLGPKAKKMPAPGEMWVWRGGGHGPWPAKDVFKVKVLDVKSGWVRYDMFDSRMKIDTFIRLYEPCNRCRCRGQDGD